MLLHCSEGGIYRECVTNLAAVRALQKARFIPLARQMFARGFSNANREAYEAAAMELEPAFRMLESVMLAYGQHVAGDSVLRLHQDVRRIQGRLKGYEGAEVLDWLARLDAELPAYAGRMASMRDAALDKAAFQGFCAALEARGFQLRRAETLGDAGPLPLAWALIADRS